MTEPKFNLRISFIFALILTHILSSVAQAAPGDLDTSFGNGGVIPSAIGMIRSVALQPDGKIVTAGASIVSGGAIALVRYNQDGSLDSSFGTGGVVDTPVFWVEFHNTLAIQTDGKIVVAGRSTSLSYSDASFAVVRYNANGTLDTSFGTGGIVITSIGNRSRPRTLKIQTDGKIVVAGEYRYNENEEFAVARYNPNGTLDTTFGNGGTVRTAFGNSGGRGQSATIQSDGKIVVLGWIYQDTLDYALVRYNTDGSLDSSFGTGGKVVAGGGRGKAVAIQTDGKILVAAGNYVGNNTGFIVVRYNTDGSLDASFGTGGTAITPGIGEAFGMAIQSNGKIVVAGTYEHDVGAQHGVVARYNPNGSLDSTFGRWGTTHAFYGSNHRFHAVIIQPDGKIIAAGEILARFHGDRLTRNTLFDFDGDGKADQAVFRNGIWYLLQSQSGFSGTQFGLSTDKIASADFDEDGKTDIAVFRDGIWYLQRSQLGFRGVQFGQAGDIPVPADYDGDGRADIAVFRNGIWYISRSGLGFTGFQFGVSTDKPVPADYDGDGKTDAAVYRDGIWYLLGSQIGFREVRFGIATDIPVVGDYDGDGKADQAVYRNGVWYLLQSTAGFTALQFGNVTDIPVAADYDGDGKTDVAVFRDGTWYQLRSQQGFAAVSFGLATDKPIPNTFVP